jgi:hypothetical protein
MGRNHGHSCPKERYGQMKHEIMKRVGSTLTNQRRSAAGTGRIDNITRYGEILKNKVNQGRGNCAESSAGKMNLKFKENLVDQP